MTMTMMNIINRSRYSTAVTSLLKKQHAYLYNKRARPAVSSSDLQLQKSFFSSGHHDHNRQEEQAKKPLDMAYGAVNAFQMNQYAIACTTTKQAALIDCGASTQQELSAFLEWMEQKQYHLTAVWQTHAHLDHVAGLGLLLSSSSVLLSQSDKNTNAEIPIPNIYLHERERDIYNQFEWTKNNYGFPVEGDGKLPEDSTLHYLTDNDTQISLGDLTFQIVPTPGHSPGHVGFYEPNTKSFFGGDFIMQGSIGRTDFPTSDPQKMSQSLQHFLQTFEDDTIIYPGHGSPVLLKQEKEYNPFLQEFL